MWFSEDDVCFSAPTMTTKRDSPFAALTTLRDQLPVGEAPRPTPAPAQDNAARSPARAVVRLEKKQRRGKEVTVVDKLGLPAAALETWCKQLKQTLGCGGTIEGDAIVLQGDFRTRLPELLTKLGVRKVTVSG
ncbi:stress response translation initiation inhibitor YciH [soil metagenome]